MRIKTFCLGHESATAFVAVIAVVVGCSLADEQAGKGADPSSAPISPAAKAASPVDSGIFHPPLCDNEAAGRYEYLYELEEPTTGDRSGYAVRIDRREDGFVSVEASEAIGSFGDLLPVKRLAADGDLLRFELTTPHPDLPGPALALRFSCDSAWGTARGPFAGAPLQPVTLLRWQDSTTRAK